MLLSHSSPHAATHRGFARYVSALLVVSFGLAGLWHTDSYSPFMGAITDALHVPAAIVLALCLQLWLAPLQRPWLAWSLGIAVLLLLEVVQPWFGRSAELSDIGNGLLGLGWVALCKHMRWHWRAVLLLLLLALGSRTLLSQLYTRLQIQNALPQLMVPIQLQHKFGWQAIGNSPLQRTITPEQSLQVAIALSAEQWQGAVWYNPALDLHEKRELCFSARAHQPMRLQLRFDDAASTDYQSRFHSAVALQPTWQRFCVNIQQLRTPQNRPIELSVLHSIYFFAKDPTPNAWFSLAQVELR